MTLIGRGLAQGPQGPVEARRGHRVEAHEEFGVVWDEVGGGSEQGLEEGPAFLAIAREQRSDTPEQGAFGPIGERPDEIGEDLALGLEPDDRVRVEGLTDGHLVRQGLRDAPVLADAFVQVLDLRAQCGPKGLGSVGRGKPGVGIGLLQPCPFPVQRREFLRAFLALRIGNRTLGIGRLGRVGAQVIEVVFLAQIAEEVLLAPTRKHP